MAFMLMAPAVNATIIYDWSGGCTVGCGGIATASLYLDDSYMPGTALTPFNGTHTTPILGLELFMPSDGTRPNYSASLMSPAYTIFGSVVNPLWLPEQSGTGGGTIFLFGGFMATSLSVAWDGSWQFGSGLSLSSVCSEALSPGGCSGTSSQWVVRAVPAPSSEFLLGLGLIVLAGMRLRKPSASVLRR
jgi:hypothetical protein